MVKSRWQRVDSGHSIGRIGYSVKLFWSSLPGLCERSCRRVCSWSLLNMLFPGIMPCRLYRRILWTTIPWKSLRTMPYEQCAIVLNGRPVEHFTWKQLWYSMLKTVKGCLVLHWTKSVGYTISIDGCSWHILGGMYIWYIYWIYVVVNRSYVVTVAWTSLFLMKVTSQLKYRELHGISAGVTS